MFSKKQYQLLKDFADINDALFDLGITTTDSFTGEIGEFIACHHFKLKKSVRSNKAVDGVAPNGDRFQIKSKVISGTNFNYTISHLQTDFFEKLVVVYLDSQYNLLKMINIPAHEIEGSVLRITKSNIQNFETVENVKIPVKIQRLLNDFASAFNALEENGIIRSRRVVGDIGEFYACKKLGLLMSEKKNEKGIDARHPNGLTFEIKTRRVYESERRISEVRRLNNLVGKTADYLIVVTLDRCFECSGMWLLPMKNLLNPKSANLKTVNTTLGTLNIIPSKISWLNNGAPFSSFESIANTKTVRKTKPPTKTSPCKSPIIISPSTNEIQSEKNNITQLLILVVAVVLAFIVAFAL